jgi:signal transduction histidine kinase/ActR/RegA family two-component response regulator
MNPPPSSQALPRSPTGIAANNRRSVRGKLMRLVTVTNAVAVCVAGIAMLLYDLSVYRGSWAAELTTQATILAVSVAPALEFDDPEVAQRNLEAMRIRSRMLIAALYGADGKLYAAYTRSGSGLAPPPAPPPTGEVVAGERVELSQPVIHNGEFLGTLYLRARYDVASRLSAYVSIFALVLALTLPATYVLSNRLQKRITAPLEAMTAVAGQIVDRRDYSLRAPKTSDDEIGIVVLAFNAMLDEIEARARASEEANAALLTSEAALREADRRKDEFLATLAHELRNPLAPIRHAVKLLEGREADEQQRQWSRTVIGRQVQRMALLLDDLLDVSRITRGRLNLKMDVVELRSVVDAALEVARPQIDAKTQHLSVTLPQEDLLLSGDPLRLSQSLSNLLTNAAKYTDAGGFISLTGTLTAAELILSVKDSGIGLDPKAIPTLFEMFSQLETAIDRAEGGLGIGLALVKGFVGLHGGRVEATSAGPGKGSEFTIHLPRSIVMLKTAEPAPPAAENPPIDADRCKVLIADDNRDAADSMALILGLSGYEVLVAHSGREAFDLAEQHRPEVVFLDIGMPDLNGYEVAGAIRRQAWGKNIYLLAVTGWGQSEDKERALAAGFDQHLTKPVDLDQVETLLREHMRAKLEPPI